MTACPHAVNELVWHFAGYFHLIEELARSRDLYNGSAYQNLQDDFAGNRVVEARVQGELEDFLTARLGPPAGPGHLRGSVDFKLGDTDPGSIPVDPVAEAGAAPTRLKTILAEAGGGGFAFRASSSSWPVPRANSIRRTSRSRSPTTIGRRSASFR